MLDKVIKTIPTMPGSYALWLHLAQSQDLGVGKLGSFTFPAGDYVYLGSAQGPGGLHSRLGRHLRGDGKIHWHIDYLRAPTQVRGFGFQTNAVYFKNGPYLLPRECTWSQKLATIQESNVVAPRFGASDCQSGCTAHLIHFPVVNVDQISNLLNCEIQILSRA